MMKRVGLILTLMILFFAVMLQPTYVNANPVKQNDPIEQCQQGMLAIFIRGYPEPARSLLEAGFAAREEVSAASQEIMNICALYLGMERYTANDWSGALEAYDYALLGFRASGDQLLEWSILYGMSGVYTAQGDYPSALDLLGQALSLSQQAQQAGDTSESWASETMPLFAEAATQNNIGYVYGLQGRYEEAQEKFEATERALERYDERVKDSEGLEELFGGTSTADPNGINGTFDIGATFAEIVNSWFYSSSFDALLFWQARQAVEVTLLNNRGEMFRLQGRYDEAHEQLGEALALLRKIGGSSASGTALPSVLTAGGANEGVVLNNIGLVYVDQKRYAEGLDHFQQARASMRVTENLAGEVAVLDNIGGWYAIQEQYEQALATFEEALALAAENPPAQAPVHTNIGLVHYARGRYAEALDSFQQALAQMMAVGNQLGEAQVRAKIAEIYITQGRYEQGLKELEQARSIMGGKGLFSSEALILNTLGVTYQAQGRYKDALDPLQQALEIWRVLGDKKNEAATLNNIGVVYREQGAYEQALSTLGQALIVRSEVNDRNAEATTLNDIGSVYYNQGRYREALENFEKAKAIMEEIGNRAGRGLVLNNIGGVYRATGRYELALEKFNEALATHREVGNRLEEGATLNNIGVVYLAQGRYGEAFDIFQQALGIWNEIGARQKATQALVNIGSVYQAQARHVEALEQFKEALQILRDVNHPLGEATALHNVGSIYIDQWEFEKALAQYEQALQIQREIGDQAGEALTLSSIGVVYVSQDKYTYGLQLFQDSLNIRREIGDRAGEGDTLANIAGVYLAQGAYKEALAHYQNALAIMREVGKPVNEGLVLSDIGFLYEQQDQYDEALAYYEDAMTIYESVRAVAGSELGRIGFAAQYVGLYEDAVRLYHAQGQYEKAFLTSERSRARAFLDSLATGEVQLSDETASDLLNQERALYAEQQATRTALAQARAFDSQSVATLEQELKEIESKHASVLDEIEKVDQKLTQLIPSRTQQASLSEIQENLDKDTTLVSYYLLGNDDTLAFLITHDDLQVVALGVSRQDLTEQITAFYQDFTNPFMNSQDAHQSENLQQLYQWLITPLKPHLNRRGVAIAPHNILHHLPFAALTDGKTYLSDEYALFTLPTASVLPIAQENSKPDTAIESVLALGNPTFDSDLAQLEGAILANLHFAEQEVEALANLFGDNIQTLFGKEATESAFRATQADILHIAAHGIYKANNPLSSMLVLADDTINDGLLEVHEIYDLELTDTTLVVLSGCETAFGNLLRRQESVVIAGDEVVSWNRAFLFAGASSVLSSLWAVDDEAGALLIERFYTHLLDGMDKAEALRQAQIDVREKYPHPYYWAGFVLTGLTSNYVPIPQPPSWPLVIGLSSLLGLVLGLAALSFSSGLWPLLLIRQRLYIFTVAGKYRPYREHWESCSPLTQLIVLLMPLEEQIELKQLHQKLVELNAPVESDQLENELNVALGQGLLQQMGDGYGLGEPYLARPLQAYEGARGRVALAKQIRHDHPLFIKARRFLQNAGFTALTLIEEPFLYCCEATSVNWTTLWKILKRPLPDPVYVRLLPNHILNGQQVRDIRDKVMDVDEGASIVFVITDQRPTYDGWGQIVTLGYESEPFTVLPIKSALINEGLATGNEETRLHQEIEKRLGAHDPYNVTTPVRDFSFFGRDELVKTLLRRITFGQPVGIFGLRKLGKSSMLHALQEQAPFPVALVNLQTSDLNETNLYQRLLHDLAQWASLRLSIEWEPPLIIATDAPTSTFVRAIRDLLGRIKNVRGEARVGVFLDEIDSIVPRSKRNDPRLSHYLALLRPLRGLVDEGVNLSLVVASLDPALNRLDHWDERNPAFQLFQDIYLPPLANEDCTQMISSIGAQIRLEYSDDVLQSIYALSGGHPLLARQLCSLLYKMLRNRRDEQNRIKVNENELINAVQRFMNDDSKVAYLDAIWQEAGNQKLWGATNAQVNHSVLFDLARAGGPVPENDLLDSPNRQAGRTALINLERFHFVHQPQTGTYAIRFGLLEKWLRWHKLGLD